MEQSEVDFVGTRHDVIDGNLLGTCRKCGATGVSPRDACLLAEVTVNAFTREDIDLDLERAHRERVAHLKARRGGRIRSVLAERVLVPVRDKATQEVTDFAVALLPTYTHQLIGELLALGLP